MTPDAADALARAGFSRREFLKWSGALIVTFSAAPETGPSYGVTLSVAAEMALLTLIVAAALAVESRAAVDTVDA